MMSPNKKQASCVTHVYSWWMFSEFAVNNILFPKTFASLFNMAACHFSIIDLFIPAAYKKFNDNPRHCMKPEISTLNFTFKCTSQTGLKQYICLGDVFEKKRHRITMNWMNCCVDKIQRTFQIVYHVIYGNNLSLSFLKIVLISIYKYINHVTAYNWN